MNHSVIDELKNQAKLLDKYFKSEGDLSPKFKLWLTKQKNLKLTDFKLDDCLQLVAIHHGFSSWQILRACFEGAEGGAGKRPSFGDFWHRPGCTGFLSHWFVTYDEALHCQNQQGGYVLGFRDQFMVVTSDYIQALGALPYSKLWIEIEFDSVRNISSQACLLLASEVAREHSLLKRIG